MALLNYIIILCVVTFSAGREPVKYKLRYLSNDGISTVLKTMKANRFEEILDPMLVTRVAGTDSNVAVRKYIAKFMKDLSWDVKFDLFEDKTPYGTRKFSNIIATLNPSAKKRLVIACHYDSKLNRENTFIMATDSAVPCAMMMMLAEDLKQPLSEKKKLSSDVTLQLIFFDGEEAFINWSAKDSLYGSRHLAAKWAKTNRREGVSELSKIEAFILLDLIGGPSPTFYNFFEETAELYNRLVDIEQKLHGLGKLSNHTMPSKYFKPAVMRAGIEDDHIPFYNKGVPVLHLIPVPFPKVWHTEKDTKENLDFTCIANLNKIFWSLVVEYLHLMQDSNS